MFIIDEFDRFIYTDANIISFDDIIRVEKIKLGHLNAVCLFDRERFYNFFLEDGIFLEQTVDSIHDADAEFVRLLEKHRRTLDTSHMFLACLLSWAAAKFHCEPEFINAGYDFDTLCRYSEMDEYGCSIVNSADWCYREILRIKPDNVAPLKKKISALCDFD